MHANSSPSPVVACLIRNLLVMIALLVAAPAMAVVFVVNSTGDAPTSEPGACDTGGAVGADPECTLRAAIQAANSLVDEATDIHFDIPDCPNEICVISITPGNMLPDIASPMTIDGSTQPGNSQVCELGIPDRPGYGIVLEGGGEDIGLRIFPGGSGSVIRGLNVRNFYTGIDIIGANNNRIECNFIGTDHTGTTAGPGNDLFGVQLGCDSSENIIGGPAPADGNLISASGIDGVRLIARFTCNPQPEDNIPTSNAILGNQIGTMADGVTPLGNVRNGIALYGGLGADGNFIGVLQDGITVHGNVIGGHGRAGIYLDSEEDSTEGSDNTLILGNFIGTDRSAQVNIANAYGGIDIIRGSNNRIGGPGANDANTIAFNSEGVWITFETSVNNTIQQNSLFSNIGLGIALIDGANNTQNAPALTAAAVDDGMVTVIYSVSTENGVLPLTVEFFIADDDNEEGQAYLASDIYEKPGSVERSFPDPGLAPGNYLVATATDANNNTSEFSLPVPVGLEAPGDDLIFHDRFEL